jgi:hypothetical protein
MSSLYVTALVFHYVKPFSGHGLALQVVIVVGWMLCMRFTVASTEELERMLGVAVLDALAFVRLTTKEAAALMRWDESNLRKALRGEPAHHISLNRLARLPVDFWMAFIPVLGYLVLRQNCRNIASDLGLRRSA